MGRGNGYPRKVSRFTLEPRASGLATVREFLRCTLRPVTPEPELEEIVSATHEAAKNAVVHNPGMEEPVDILCEVSGRSITVEVTDRGGGFDPGELPPAQPDPEALEGRGIFLIYSLMDDVVTESGERGTRIRMRKMLATT